MWSPTAAARRWCLVVGSGTTPPTSTRWRWVSASKGLAWCRVGVLSGHIFGEPAGLSSRSFLPGRLHHQAGNLHPRAPEGHRGCGHWHCLCAGAGTRAAVGSWGWAGGLRCSLTPAWLCAGLRHGLHVLLVQEPQAGALLTTRVWPGHSPPAASHLTTELTADCQEGAHLHACALHATTMTSANPTLGVASSTFFLRSGEESHPQHREDVSGLPVWGSGPRPGR